MSYHELTENIIGCAFRVHKELGYGFLESVYEKSPTIELGRVGLKSEAQKPISVSYDGEIVDYFVPDIIVDDTIILEIKSTKEIIKPFEVQLVNYIKATGKLIGLVINFGEKGVDVKRRLRTLPNNHQ